MNLFTVVSLVIAISGATYGAIAAIRSCWESEIREARETGRTLISSIHQTIQDTGKNKETKLAKTAERSYAKLVLWLKWWDRAFFLPVFLFAIVAHGLAIVVCCRSWDGSVPSDCAWGFYKWLLLAMVTIDLLGIFLTAFAKRQIRKNQEDLNERQDIATEELGISKVPSYPAPPTPPTTRPESSRRSR